ncbi:glycoside hydrolase family 88 protein [Martelella lutilitoris]|uniref:Glycoside hydrolase family 88 protein n=1 Tax=Martelella lutilitoris TaxID=2583532 RepID=A0A7T7HJS0_9HYPH|nr:glycoside hydrolase family 88 protein [Martelella lutilitoris]QQM30419.1 glycoside hydrolase family 88 protein [Martelella lutilitoris]
MASPRDVVGRRSTLSRKVCPMNDMFPVHDEGRIIPPIAAETQQDLEAVKADILGSIERNAPRIGSRNPMIGAGADDHRWLYPEIGYFWTDSFWIGELWLAHMLTGDQRYKNMARMRNLHLERILNTPLWLSHDLGFLFSLSAVADYKLTGNQQARTLALRAADALKGRFNWAGDYLVAWTASRENMEHAAKVQGKVIIDSIQNLSLLLWAYQETCIASYRDAALRHAETLKKHIVRSDYSTFHTFDFDTSTAMPIGGNTAQGYADASCWSRGQAWGIHGFAQLAETTGNLEFLELSAKLADYALEKMGDDYVPDWDYLLPAGEERIKDSSAGAVTSSGLFILADVLCRIGDQKRGQHYRTAALKMLFALRERHDLTGDPDAEGLLSAGASHVHGAKAQGRPNLANAMLPYGDYYYFEAVLRGLGYRQFFW